MEKENSIGIHIYKTADLNNPKINFELKSNSREILDRYSSLQKPTTLKQCAENIAIALRLYYKKNDISAGIFFTNPYNDSPLYIMTDSSGARLLVTLDKSEIITFWNYFSNYLSCYIEKKL